MVDAFAGEQFEGTVTQIRYSPTEVQGVVTYAAVRLRLVVLVAAWVPLLGLVGAVVVGGGAAVLNYPVSHHRQRRQARLEENEREPLFASTWPDFDDWPPGHEARLDAEIERADAILLGSTFAADSFAAEGIERRKLQVIPYGVDLQTFTPGRARRKQTFDVIYAGQLTQRKGISYLLRGYRKFARRDTQLTMVGALVGGALTFDSVPGRGTTFHIRLPISKIALEAVA